LATLVAEQAEATPDAVALMCDDARLTYAILAERIDRHAAWALGQGLQPGESVCLLMENCAEFVAIWLGVTRIGGVAALLNTSLRGAALLHCARAAAPKHVVVGAAFASDIDTLAAGLGPDVGFWVAGESFERIGARSTAPHAGATPPEIPPRPRDTALLIYTSGTTGLPKAARISHARLLAWAHWFAGMMDATAQDRMYNCLPLYHSVGGVVAVGALLVSGGSVVIRPGFSASRFWDEVVDYDCTLFQYIGELCRYLANAPSHSRERDHRLRLCVGNGLRGDVWERFSARFAIPAILEFYAATEGNISLYNCEGRPGAIGRVPGFLVHRFAAALVRLDAVSGEPMRNADGFCVACEANEPGEALGRIHDSNFEGYTDDAASDRKILRDVFATGDSWFRTGDLMRKDASGFYFFVDRLGDTFRWKGENVSTAEVADAVASCPGVLDAAVFGVAVPGADGRAGMAAIAVDADFSLAELRRHLAERLPDYARPCFLRLCDRIDATGTFKLAKARLAQQGYGENPQGEPCFFDDRAQGAFVPIDADLRARIEAGVRL
jgi:fatty-acyl-CoA synthase